MSAPVFIRIKAWAVEAAYQRHPEVVPCTGEVHRRIGKTIHCCALGVLAFDRGWKPRKRFGLESEAMKVIGIPKSYGWGFADGFDGTIADPDRYDSVTRESLYFQGFNDGRAAARRMAPLMAKEDA